VQGLLERLAKMPKDPLGHMSSLFAPVLIGAPEMNSVQDTDENNIVRSIRETVVSFRWLNAGRCVRRRHYRRLIVSVEEQRKSAQGQVIDYFNPSMSTAS